MKIRTVYLACKKCEHYPSTERAYDNISFLMLLTCDKLLYYKQILRAFGIQNSQPHEASC